MVLDRRRDLSDKIFNPIALKFKGFNPNTISLFSLLSAVVAGVCFYLGGFYLLWAAVFVGLNAFFDILDGRLARITNQQFPRGCFLDNIFDRYSDVFMFVGIMFSPYSRGLTGFFVILGTLLTSSVGSLGCVCCVGRIRGSLFSRADRLFMLILIPIVQFILIKSHVELIHGLWFTEWIMILLAVVGNLSAIHRAFMLWKKLN